MKPEILYHCTTPKKAKLYSETGCIRQPVRGFDSEQGALAWCVKTGRTVVLEISGWSQDDIHMLPDHHNKYATAYWVNQDVKERNCVFSADKDA